jgi:hypothetical protein
MEATGEDLAAAVRDLSASMKASMNALRTSMEDSKTILREVVAWRPQVDGALQDMRSDLNTLRQQLGRVALNPILAVDPAKLHAPSSSTTMAASEAAAGSYGDGGRGPGGHGASH